MRLSLAARALALLALTAGAGAGPAHAEFRATTCLRVSVAPHPTIDPVCTPIAGLFEGSAGGIDLVVGVFERANGYIEQDNVLVIPFPARGPRPADVLISTVFAPGSVLVLDTARTVHVFPLRFDARGRPLLAAAPSTLGPFAPDAGAGTVLGEAPNAAEPDRPFLGIGTMSGKVILLVRQIDPVCSPTIDPICMPVIDLGFDPVCTPVAPGPVLDLGAVSQAGYFALAAVVHDSRGVGHLIGVNPDADARTPGLQPETTFSLRDPRSAPLLDFGSEILDRFSKPGLDPICSPNLDPICSPFTSVVTANGTREIATLAVPANARDGGELALARIDQLASPIRQVVFGSLTFVPNDGAGVLYNRAFTFEAGIAGRLWTLLGASMVFNPETLNLRSRGQWVEVALEADNNRAAQIDAETLLLSVEGVAGAVPAARRPSPRREDVDGDTNGELVAKFDRTAVQRLLAQTGEEAALMRCTWRYRDGSTGSASTLVRVVR